MAFNLQNIQRGGGNKPPRVVIHGTPGVGKTTFAACAPEPIFIQCEDGLGQLDVDAFPLAATWDNVMAAFGSLYTEPHEYKTLVVDSLSALEELIWQQVAKAANKGNIEDLGYGKGYIIALDYWKQFWDGINALRDKGMMPVLIAHSNIKRYDSPEVEPYDRYQIKLHERAFQLVYERADVIGFANYETNVTKAEVGFNQKVARGIGTGRRLLHLNEKPAYIAKNRYSLPDSIPLDWSEFMGSFNQNQTTNAA